MALPRFLDRANSLACVPNPMFARVIEKNTSASEVTFSVAVRILERGSLLIVATFAAGIDLAEAAFEEVLGYRRCDRIYSQFASQNDL